MPQTTAEGSGVGPSSDDRSAADRTPDGAAAGEAGMADGRLAEARAVLVAIDAVVFAARRRPTASEHHADLARAVTALFGNG
jgi:hypothetical protein